MPLPQRQMVLSTPTPSAHFFWFLVSFQTIDVFSARSVFCNATFCLADNRTYQFQAEDEKDFEEYALHLNSICFILKKPWKLILFRL